MAFSKQNFHQSGVPADRLIQLAKMGVLGFQFRDSISQRFWRN